MTSTLLTNADVCGPAARRATHNASGSPGAHLRKAQDSPSRTIGKTSGVSTPWPEWRVMEAFQRSESRGPRHRTLESNGEGTATRER
jgi:hypothetical protein